MSRRELSKRELTKRRPPKRVNGRGGGRGGGRGEGRGKRALVTGVTGQDGAYLARLLLAKGYKVHGIKRRSSSFNTGRIDGIYVDPHERETRFHLHYGDLVDSTNVIRLVQAVKPDEIHKLAAQSHVQVSFETPEYTANADAIDPRYFRPTEVDLPLGDATKARKQLGRRHETTFSQLVAEMMEADIARARLGHAAWRADGEGERETDFELEHQWL